MHTCVYCGVRYQSSQGTPRPATPTTPVTPVTARRVPRRRLVVFGVVCAAMVVITAVYGPRETTPNRARVTAGLAPGPASAGPVANPVLSVEVPAEAVAPATAEFTLETVQRSSTDAVWIYGYLHNTSSFVLGKTKITAVFYDKAGAEVGQGSGYTEDDVIAADARVPTVLLVTAAPAAYERLAFEVHAERPSYVPEQVQGLELAAEPPRRDTFLGWKYVGKVHNKSGRPAKFVRVDVFAFDHNAKLAGHAFTYASGDVLADGATARFDGTLLDSKTGFKRFEFTVRGQPGP